MTEDVLVHEVEREDREGKLRGPEGDGGREGGRGGGRGGGREGGTEGGREEGREGAEGVQVGEGALISCMTAVVRRYC